MDYLLVEDFPTLLSKAVWRLLAPFHGDFTGFQTPEVMTKNVYAYFYFLLVSP